MVITVAPMSGATRRSSMNLACLNTLSTAAGYGGIGTASTMPVASPPGMSFADRATGWKPFALYHCTMASLPWLVNSLVCFN